MQGARGGDDVAEHAVVEAGDLEGVLGVGV